MDIEDTPQCTADYLNLGANYEQERLCGLMLRNSRSKLIIFKLQNKLANRKNTKTLKQF